MMCLVQKKECVHEHCVLACTYVRCVELSVCLEKKKQAGKQASRQQQQNMIGMKGATEIDFVFSLL